MGYIVYTCSDDFPTKIPEILSELSPQAVCRKKEQAVEPELDSYYHYQVELGSGRIAIYGSREDSVMNVAITTGTLNPFRWRSSAKLDRDARSALVKAGMKEVTIEDIERFEAQRKQEAEQAGGGQAATRSESA